MEMEMENPKTPQEREREREYHAGVAVDGVDAAVGAGEHHLGGDELLDAEDNAVAAL